MKVYRDLAQACADPTRERRVVTVGFFDGVHVGHQTLLRQLTDWAQETSRQPALVTFVSHPARTLRGVSPPLVLSLRHRLLLFAGAGMAAVLPLRFTAELAAWSADEFVEKVLVRGLHADKVLMGFDSAWGHRREGTFGALAARAAQLGIELRQGSVAHVAAERVSSTLVRNAVAAGDLERLRALLGRRYSLLGTVVHGDGRGRTLGFPTANLDVDSDMLPPSGVYFASVTRWGRLAGTLTAATDGSNDATDAAAEVHDAVPWQPQPLATDLPALVNIGTRPTFRSGDARTLEAQLIDFDGDLYGEDLEIELLRAHRDERRFASAAELKAQIERDRTALIEYWALRSSSG